jgi:SPP1 family predicted phage head-tail adaptor
MRNSKVINLISVTVTQDEIGNEIQSTEKRQVFAAKKSITQSEFYQAAASGLKPELVFIVWQLEYNGEQKLEYEGEIYTVIRTYERPDQRIELYCEVRIGG